MELSAALKGRVSALDSSASLDVIQVLYPLTPIHTRTYPDIYPNMYPNRYPNIYPN